MLEVTRDEARSGSWRRSERRRTWPCSTSSSRPPANRGCSRTRPVHPRRASYRPALERPWQHLEHAVEEAREDASDASLHAAGSAPSEARYAAEACLPVFGKRAEAFAARRPISRTPSATTRIRSWRGRGCGGGRGGADAFVAGELVAIEAQAAADARAAWPKAWKALSRKRLRFWV